MRCEQDTFPALNENFHKMASAERGRGKEYSVFIPKGRSLENNRPFTRRLDGKVMSFTKYAEMEELNN